MGTLGEVAAELDQLVMVLGGFHTFGHRMDPHGVRELDAAREDGRVTPSAFRSLKERSAVRIVHDRRLRDLERDLTGIATMAREGPGHQRHEAGCCQRTSASTPSTSPDGRRMRGW